jgi:HSP20 family molecular chaperone IbpA
MISEFTITNGKLLDSTYKLDFHLFHHDNQIHIYLLLPGVIAKSIQVKIDNLILTIHGFVHKKFVKIFKNNQIQIKGELPVLVEPSTVNVEYDMGIFLIKLSPKVSQKV